MSDILKNKFSEYEVLPPEDVWKHIVSELEDGRVHQPLKDKMYALEFSPPEDAWRNIGLLLKKESVTPIRNMRSLVAKLAAAAVVVGLVFAASLFFFHQQSASQQETISKAENPQPDSEKQTPSVTDLPIDQPPVATSLPTLILRRNNSTANRSMAKAHYRQKRRVLAAASIRDGYIDRSKEMNDIIVQGRLIRNESGDIIQNSRMLTGGGNDDYISVTGPNGQQTRISSKFANVMLYLNGNENMQDQEWQRTFQEWRNKIMQTSFIPSSSNFLDILELKDFILKDEKQ